MLWITRRNRLKNPIFMGQMVYCAIGQGNGARSVSFRNGLIVGR
ncbi:MAG: hypothetical protein AVDCRST_MAG78-3547 [uncultured Rubrobacteraceae bacterium]|uniref:Uncharacterized protein n=1 Tax=uncultured Rubrobacteraceae bacterium TaxID=349277 RepID=A0A6J4R0T6_9ACTN|nr:MAG: hypothetical protein AVDCRST_MAG78-3547 [uncultured Rubrobacteraceae bacterium]